MLLVDGQLIFRTSVISWYKSKVHVRPGSASHMASTASEERKARNTSNKVAVKPDNLFGCVEGSRIFFVDRRPALHPCGID